METRLKICGMKDPANIMEVSGLMPDYFGFIFYKGSKRYAGELNPSIISGLPSGLLKIGVFVNEDLEEVLDSIKKYRLSGVQLHGSEPATYCAELRTRVGKSMQLIKAFGVNENFDFATLVPYEEVVDYFLFDTQTSDHGGSGKHFNWGLLEKYKLDKPYFLSGGIGEDDIDALNNIDDHRFFAIDVNSRFELAPGIKDFDKLKHFKTRL